MRILKLTAHAAALIFGAFWLVATTSLPGPPRDCFTGLASETKLAVTVGSAIVETDGGAAATPSCGTLDGLSSGGALTFTLSKETGTHHDGRCQGYETRAIEGVSGVTLDRHPSTVWDVLTIVGGSYTGPSGCSGDWTIQLAPEAAPPPGDLISPLDAGPSQRWVVVRTMNIDQAQSCGGIFADPGVVWCADQFQVESIVVAP